MPWDAGREYTTPGSCGHANVSTQSQRDELGRSQVNTERVCLGVADAGRALAVVVGCRTRGLGWASPAAAVGVTTHKARADAVSCACSLHSPAGSSPKSVLLPATARRAR